MAGVGVLHQVIRIPLRSFDDRTECGTIKGQEVPIMSLEKDIRPITYLKTRAADLLKQVNET